MFMCFHLDYITKASNHLIARAHTFHPLRPQRVSQNVAFNSKVYE